MFTLNDHFTDIEQELEVKLFRNSDCFAEFDETELTRGDTKTIAEYNKAAIGSMQQPGWLTPNEVRANVGMEPVEGGEKLFMPDPSTQQPAKGGANDAQK
jgi:phage portal protein BeeE